MSIQIKKKFIKPQSIDGTKVLFLNEDPFKAMKSNGDVTELFKFTIGNKLEMLQMPQVSSDPVANEDLARKGYVDSQLSLEQAARETAVSTEASRALAAEAILQAAIDAEALARISDVGSEETRALAAEAVEKTAREAADASLQDALDIETVARQAADLVLQTAIDTEKERVNAILLSSQADKDSFAEIVQLINSVDTENDSAFASYVLSNNAALAQEVLDRQAGDTTLQSAINTEASARATAVSSEQAARVAADAVLTSDLAAEIARATAAESSEATARAGADTALDSRLDVLEADPTTKAYVDQQISSLTSDVTDIDGYAQDVRSDLDQEILDRIADVNAEETRATGVEATLSASIISEASARAAAISSEQAARIAQDLVLDGKISTKFQESKDYTDQKVADLVASAPAVLDTLNELAVALGSDANFATTVASQIANAANNLGDRFMYEQFVVDSGMISAGYIDLGHKGFAASMVVSNGRLMLFEGEDYSVSVVEGKSRLTFIGSMLSSEVEALESGDIIKVRYLKDVR